MEEAVEICKLRLFLKLAAQLEPGQQVEPLPDIDFNIRAGNTLVGYASRAEIRRAFTEHQGGGKASQLLLGGIEHSLDDYRRIEEQAEDADRAFQRFHQLQEATKMDAAEFRSAKQSLHRTLEVMRDQLDRFLASDYNKSNLKTDTAFTKWRKSHQPFHWFIEFYGIMNKGGFDVIIGNPPWVELSRASRTYVPRNLTSWECNNLWPPVVERCYHLTSRFKRLGLIVPMSLVCTERMAPIQRIVKNAGETWLANFESDSNPGQLFDGVKQNVTILLSRVDLLGHIRTTKLAPFCSAVQTSSFSCD